MRGRRLFHIRVLCCAALASLEVQPAEAALTRGPYLQLLTTNSVTIVWNTDVSGACSVAIRPLGGATSVIAGGTGTVCAIPVAGLAPGIEYGYIPRANGTALTTESVFRTDDPTRPYTFLVVGDTGDGNSDQMAVRNRMVATPADFIVHTGDMIYDDGEAQDFNPHFFTPYQALVRRLVFWPCLGNHDWHTSSGGPWRDAFYTPANNAAATENYYSFDYGNAHVVVINTNSSTSSGSAQYQFLDQDLGASTARWKFVSFHHTIYSSSSNHGSNTTIRNNLLPLFDEHAVDIVFMGHDHTYERTKPLRQNVVVAPGAGTVYVTTGGGGKDLYNVGTSSFTAYSESAHHFTRVMVSGDTLIEQMIRVDGVVRDEMTLTKGAATTSTTTSTVISSSTTTTSTSGSTTTTTPPVALQAMEDTYIEAGAEGGFDHGGSDHLDVDEQPAGITYLKFDLRGVPPPARATLRLHCSNASDSGGTVYPVLDSSWVEGTGNGTASGPGLKWSDVDTNQDGTIGAGDTSPFVPDFGQPAGTLGSVSAGQTYSVDVTTAVQAGPAIYTLAIRNQSTNGATFSSRNHPTSSQRPVLQLGDQTAGCTNLSGPRNDITATSLRLARLGTPPATLSLKGRFIIPVPFSPAIDLVTHGFRLTLHDDDSNAFISALVPGGFYDGTRGWRANRDGTRWTFRDRGKPPLFGGIVRVLVSDESRRTPGQIGVTVSGKGNYAVDFASTPFQLQMTLNEAANGGGASQCGEATFTAGDCAFGGTGTSLRCR